MLVPGRIVHEAADGIFSADRGGFFSSKRLSLFWLGVMRRDTAIVFVVLLVVACVSVGSAIWLAKELRDEVWAEFESTAGLKCAVTSSEYWEVSQAVYFCVSGAGLPAERTFVATGLPDENAARRFEFLAARDGTAVALVQTWPDRRLLGLYDHATGLLSRYEGSVRVHQKLWREIAGENEIDGAFSRDFWR